MPNRKGSLFRIELHPPDLPGKNDFVGAEHPDMKAAAFDDHSALFGLGDNLFGADEDQPLEVFDHGLFFH